MTAATCLWGLCHSQVTGPGLGAQAGALWARRDAPPRERKSILSRPGDASGKYDPPAPMRTPWLWQSRGLLLGSASQEPGTCPQERVEEVALGVDDGNTKEMAASTGCSEVLPAPLHTQGGEPKPRLEPVALAPV